MPKKRKSKSKKVPLTVIVDGVKRVVGEGLVTQQADGSFYVEARFTAPETTHDPNQLSLDS